MIVRQWARRDNDNYCHTFILFNCKYRKTIRFKNTNQYMDSVSELDQNLLGNYFNSSFRLELQME